MTVEGGGIPAWEAYTDSEGHYYLSDTIPEDDRPMTFGKSGYAIYDGSCGAQETREDRTAYPEGDLIIQCMPSADPFEVTTESDDPTIPNSVTFTIKIWDPRDVPIGGHPNSYDATGVSIDISQGGIVKTFTLSDVTLNWVSSGPWYYGEATTSPAWDGTKAGSQDKIDVGQYTIFGWATDYEEENRMCLAS